MNFFDHQDKARRNTFLLTALFLSAVLGLIAITTLFLALIANYSQLQSLSPGEIVTSLGWDTVAGISITIGAIVGLASLYRLRQLAAGGRAVAESLGGRKINLCPKGLAEQRALNVVEEMALASGTPVPEVYILDDDAINAFAAGYKHTDAVIGLTRGCIEQLNREELQGVVAHEFSHIFNGDMRLNIRIVGLLYGILIIGLLGSWLLRGSSWGNRQNRGRGRIPIFFIGAGLVLIGYTGTFFGKLIKSAMSRQREYLADASAVQFTRNNQGIANALKKIGGHHHGSGLSAVNAGEFSHMYFASGLAPTFSHWLPGIFTRFASGFFATHPPLETRIHRLDPSWNERPSSQIATPSLTSLLTPGQPTARSNEPAEMTAALAPYQTRLERVMDAVDNSIVVPSAAQLAMGRDQLAQLPDNLKLIAHDPFAARALVYGLLLAPAGKQEVHRQKQLTLLEKFAHPAVLRELRQLLPSLESLPLSFRLPLLDLCIPALKELAPQQYQIFKRNLIKLIRADGKLEIWEWALYRVLLHALEGNPDQQRKSPGRSDLKKAQADAQRFLLAAMAHTGNPDYLSAKRAYEAGLKVMEQRPTPLPTSSDITLQRLDKALAFATDTAPLKKPALLKALAATLAHDGEVQARELELLRAIADCLDCPMPPIPLDRFVDSQPPARHKSVDITPATI